MNESIQQHDLKGILGAMIFASGGELSFRDMERCLTEVAEASGGASAGYHRIRQPEIAAALEELKVALDSAQTGFHVKEAAGGFTLESDPACGPWLKHLLNVRRPQRLSHPALETLAIIAYRQPISRADIETVRGVNVDHVIRKLLEIQLIRIAGRSDLPGRPFLYGTTHAFLGHFGLKDLGDLGRMDPMLSQAAAPRAPANAPEQADNAEDDGGPPPSQESHGEANEEIVEDDEDEDGEDDELG
ncbi:MAG: SMC-Scp complex subunit ScpB [Lentisphaerae bacterium]|nr:SMC-Scp complex subunit ScpB [Lentisphaerota bacterium]